MPVENSLWLVPAAREAYRSREEIAGLWQSIADRFAGKRTSIAVTGLSGAGKTVLFDHLTGSAFKQGYHPPDKSRAAEVGKLPIRGHRIDFTTVPGQESPPRLKATTKVFDPRHPVDGVIHVVSNGFISLREQAARQVLIRDQGVETIADLRQHFLEAELENLRETLQLMRPSLSKKRKPSWMMIAVTKADLFANELVKAEQYYGPSAKSAFVERLKEFTSQVGSDNFGWEAVPVATWLEDFGWNEEAVASQLKPDQRDAFVGRFAAVLEKHCGT